MRTVLSRLAVIAVALAGLSAAANAQVLVSADNIAVKTYYNAFSEMLLLDGTNDVLYFTTTQPNEVVQLSFAASQCGIVQTNPQTVSMLNVSSLQATFYLDGNAVPNSNAALCAYSVLPAALGMTSVTKAKLQQRVTISSVGTHTLKVLLTPRVTADGTGINPMLGHTHALVSR